MAKTLHDVKIGDEYPVRERIANAAKALGVGVVVNAVLLSPAVFIAEYDDGALNPFNPDSNLYVGEVWPW